MSGALIQSTAAGLLWPAVPGRPGAELLAQLYQLEPDPVLSVAASTCPATAAVCALGAPCCGNLGILCRTPGGFGAGLDLATFSCVAAAHAARADPGPANPLPAAARVTQWHEIQTSGSTGEVVAVRRTGVNQLLWLALSMRDHLWHQRDFRETLCVIRGNVDARDDARLARDADDQVRARRLRGGRATLQLWTRPAGARPRARSPTQHGRVTERPTLLAARRSAPFPPNRSNPPIPELIQHDLEQVEMRLVVSARLDAKAEARLTEIVQQALAHPFQIRFSYVAGELARSAAGKFEEFVCRVVD